MQIPIIKTLENYFILDLGQCKRGIFQDRSAMQIYSSTDITNQSVDIFHISLGIVRGHRPSPRTVVTATTRLIGTTVPTKVCRICQTSTLLSQSKNK